GWVRLLAILTYETLGALRPPPRRTTREPCPIRAEPIQGEGGINVSPPGYLQGLRELADKHNLLLIFDEVQAGMGRTGKWFGHQHWEVKPDAMTLAKAVAGGVACGALVARPDVAEELKPGTHAATSGGNPIACRAGLATIETIEKDGLLARAEKIGARFKERFEALRPRCPAIQQVRVCGAMIGLELSVDGAPLVDQCLRRRLLI